MSTQKTNDDTYSEKKGDVVPEKKEQGDAVKMSDSSQARNTPIDAEAIVTNKHLENKTKVKVFEKSDSMQPVLQPEETTEGEKDEVKREESVTEDVRFSIDEIEGEKDKVREEKGGMQVLRSQKEIDSKEGEIVKKPADNSKVPDVPAAKNLDPAAKKLDSKGDEKVNRPSESSDYQESILLNDIEDPNPGHLSMQKVCSPRSTENLQDTKEERKQRPPPEQHQPREDLRTPLLEQNNQPKDDSASKCGCLSYCLSCLSCLKPDEEPCQWTDFLKCGEQWENKPALKYVRLFCLLLPAVTMIILQIVNSTQDDTLVDSYCLRPRDKNGFGPLFVNIFFYRNWSDAICMTIVYVIIAASVMIRGNRVFLISSVWIILAYGLLYWGIALGSNCQAGVSTLNLGLALFNVTQGGLEFLWKMETNYYALIASLVTVTTYFALLFKKVIPDARSSFWAHLFSSLAGVLVSIAYAWRRRKRSTREKDSGDALA